MVVHDQIKIPVVIKIKRNQLKVLNKTGIRNIKHIVRSNFISEQVFENSGVIKELLRDYRENEIRMIN